MSNIIRLTIKNGKTSGARLVSAAEAKVAFELDCFGMEFSIECMTKQPLYLIKVEETIFHLRTKEECIALLRPETPDFVDNDTMFKKHLKGSVSWISLKQEYPEETTPTKVMLTLGENGVTVSASTGPVEVTLLNYHNQPNTEGGNFAGETFPMVQGSMIQYLEAGAIVSEQDFNLMLAEAEKAHPLE